MIKSILALQWPSRIYKLEPILLTNHPLLMHCHAAYFFSHPLLLQILIYLSQSNPNINQLILLRKGNQSTSKSSKQHIKWSIKGASSSSTSSSSIRGRCISLQGINNLFMFSYWLLMFHVFDVFECFVCILTI